MLFQFESLTDFMYMSGHGPYVWGSYIVTAIALGALVVLPLLKQRQSFIRLKRQQRIEAGQSQSLIIK
ncbi:heme exporter protein CcmD [Candidatus Endobugula sertula]|uniref:Heme exporter protein D n=1 Tax=Candidatus Endobugula sertula TaxID=62101 RepID=A0A1D2QT33_9GAMM|nr:heme exporter protein CcmD [Candidatus Endobugula sertula]